MRQPLVATTSSHIRRRNGFTLVELLVSMAVIALLLTFVMEMLSSTTATITKSNAQMDTGSLARIVLDRFGTDFTAAVLCGGTSALYYSDTSVSNSGNPAIAFVTASRARGPTTSTSAWTTDTRSAFIGYKMRSTAQNVGGSNAPSIPSLSRGDGRFTFSTADIANAASYNLWDAFGTGNLRIPNDLTTTATDEHVLNWQVIANAIFLWHISFVLDDGRIVQTPPSFRNFFVNVGTGNSVPIAFSKEVSADPNGRYVKGLIVGVVVLDVATRNLAYSVDNSFWTTIAGKIQRPNADGQTPTQVWNTNLATLTSNNPTNSQYLFPPVRQNIRFYQRFYSVHP